MSSRPEAWLAVAPAHLPHYSHTAVTVGTVILLAIIVMVTMAALAVALSQGRRRPARSTAAPARWWLPRPRGPDVSRAATT